MILRIVTDSTADLPQSMVAEHAITVVPQYLNFGNQSYLDGVDLLREDFYHKLQASGEKVTTAAPAPEMFRQVYEQLAEKGVEQVLSIHVSGSLSNTLDAARLGAQETRSVKVTVLDSRQLSFGLGFLVLEAARAAAEGASPESLLVRLQQQILRTHVFAGLDTLEYLRRSGRMNRAIAGLGTVLKVKPIIKMYDGVPTSERVRTRERAAGRLIELISEQAPLERLAMLHSNARERAAALGERIRHLFPAGEVPIVNVTPIIGAHVGPGAVGFACVAAARI